MVSNSKSAERWNLDYKHVTSLQKIPLAIQWLNKNIHKLIQKEKNMENPWKAFIVKKQSHDVAYSKRL